MRAAGTFEVKLAPQDDADAPAGRLLINKTYAGQMQGSGVGQMISKRLDNGTAVYFAVEEFSGSIAGKSGAFTLLHVGRMDATSQALEVSILDGSGSGELDSISGTMRIAQDDNGHSYELKYAL